MTRTGVTILLVGLLIVGLGGALFLAIFVGVGNPESFFLAIQVSWGVGGLLVLVGGVIALIGRMSKLKS